MMRFLPPALGIVLVGLAAPAPAALIVGHYEGAVANPLSSGPPAYPFAIGEGVALDFEIDTTALVALGAGGYQGRSATARLTTAGGFSRAIDDPTRLLTLTLQDGPVDRLFLLLQSAMFAAGINLRLEDPTGTALASEDLNTPFDLAAFGAGRLAYDRDLGLEGEGFVATVAVAPVPVPEPATLASALAGLALAIGAAARRRRRRGGLVSRPQFGLATLMLLIAVAAAVSANARIVLDFLASLPHSQYSR